MYYVCVCAKQDKDRGYFVGEAREHGVRLEAAEAALIERERELAKAREELAWVRWAGPEIIVPFFAIIYESAHSLVVCLVLLSSY